MLQILLWVALAPLAAAAGGWVAGVVQPMLAGRAAEAALAAAVLALAARRFSVGLTRRPLPGFSLGLAVMAVALAVTFGLALTQGQALASPVARPAWLGLGVGALGWLAHGFAEEALFRGVALGAVRSRFGAVAGVAVAAALWAVYQAWQGYAAPTALLVSLGLGVAFGALAVRHGLWAAVAAHAAWGFLELDLLGPEGPVFVRFVSIADTATAPLFAAIVLVLALAAGVLSRRGG